MKAFVDKEGCISCGICINMCPDVFQFDDNEKSTVVMEDILCGLRVGVWSIPRLF